MFASNNFEVQNDGLVSTYHKDGKYSYIDLTWCSDHMKEKCVQWMVLEEETCSDHRYVYFEIADANLQHETGTNYRANGYRLQRLDKNRRLETFGEYVGKCRIETVEELMKAVKVACDYSTSKRGGSTHKQKQVYWWTQEIAMLRKECLRKRRKLTKLRSRAKGYANVSSLLREYAASYKEAKKTLSNKILKGKSRRWQELCDEIDTDPWGKGFKIVTKKLEVATSPKMSPERKKEIVDQLFPMIPVQQILISVEDEQEPVQLTKAELLDAAARTVDAIKEVCNIAAKEKRKTLKTRGICALVTVDVKNVFNSIPWGVIHEEIARIGISAHIRRLIVSYLTDRYINLGDGSSRALTCGVPQGSVLGPTLWNIAYDSVLSLSVRGNVHLVAYADDLAIIATARKETELQANMNHALRLVKKEITEKGLKIAIDKTEAIFLNGRKKFCPFHFSIDQEEIRTTQVWFLIAICRMENTWRTSPRRRRRRRRR